jgi:surface antigen
MCAERTRSLALILTLGILLPTLSVAQNVGFLKDSAVSYFSDQDVEMMMKSADDALDDDDVRAKREWTNAASGNSGKAEVLKAFKNSAGASCKRLQFSHLVHNGVTGRSAYTFCKHADKWMIDSSGSK